ncbi:MAG: DUF4197 family protein [Deltaproteobacteria bacterium]|nr:DUF4197 family protein [Deltaproteobacteria bacterium]
MVLSATSKYPIRLNRAAEAAVPKATDLFVDAIKTMLFDDARRILQGEETAATQYFKDKTSSETPRAKPRGVSLYFHLRRLVSSRFIFFARHLAGLNHSGLYAKLRQNNRLKQKPDDHHPNNQQQPFHGIIPRLCLKFVLS